MPRRPAILVRGNLYRTKSRGKQTDPCKTPKMRQISSEMKRGIIYTISSQIDRSETSLVQFFLSVCSGMLWYMVSTAVDRSNNINTTAFGHQCCVVCHFNTLENSYSTVKMTICRLQRFTQFIVIKITI